MAKSSTKPVDRKPSTTPRAKQAAGARGGEIVSREPKIRLTLTESQRWVICFFLLFMSAFVTLSVVSHYFTWKADQMGLGVANIGGSWGLKIASTLVGDWFGLFALCIPAIGFILAYVAVSGNRGGMLMRTVKILVAAMLIGSFSLGAVLGADGSFGSGMGGKLGIDVAAWLSGEIGRLGVGLLMFMSWLLWALYVNSTRTIGAMNKLAHKTASIFRPRRTIITDGEDDGDDDESDRVLPEKEEDEFIEIERGEDGSLEDENEHSDADDNEENDNGDTEEDDNNTTTLTDDENNDAKEGGELEIVVPKDEDFVDVDNETFPNGEDNNDELGGEVVKPQPAEPQEVIDEDLEIVDTELGGMEGLPTDDTHSRTQTDEQLDDELTDVQIGTGGVVETGDDGSVQVVKDGHTDEDAGKIGTLYDPTKELSRFKRPPLEILEKYDEDGVQYSVEEINENKEIIEQTLDIFGVKIRKITATIGPTVTLYEIEPEKGTKVAKIKNLEDDIAISLKAVSIRLIAPMPGRGTIGVEIPNRTRRRVSMYSVLKSKKFQESKYALPVVIGKTIQNETFIFDLADMPHMIVAGATGQGKSVGLNAIIASLIYKRHPAELKFVMVDPKKVELSLYSRLENYYLAKMESAEEAILTDTQKVVYTLNSLCIEMEERYKLLKAAGVKRIDAYNQKFLERRLHPKYGHRYLPYIVVVIDEFADMIMTAGKEVETPIQRLGQLARAIGIHLIIATQRPDAKVITGLISSNCPARMGFKVANMINSRIILGEPGAEKLVGKGDMLMQINGETTRLQCAFIDTPEIDRIVDFVAAQQGYSSAYLLPDYVPEDADHGEPHEDVGELDSKFEEVARYVVGNQQGSTSFIQRKYKIGYTRAARIMDQLEAYGIVGKSDGGKPREVFVSDLPSLERMLRDIFIENF